MWAEWVAQNLQTRAAADRFVPIELHPRQQEFYDDDRADLLFGGAAGGGKTIAQLASAAKFVHVPNYAAVLIRRAYTHLEQPGAFIPTSREWWSGTAAHYNQSQKTWHFPSGATVSFGYLDNIRDLDRYQGAEYQYCLALETPVLMADGDWKPLRHIEPGEWVATLDGPRPVIRRHLNGVRPVIRLSSSSGHVVATPEHRFLSGSAFVAPMAVQSILSRAAFGLARASSLKYREAQPLGACLYQDRWQSIESHQRYRWDMRRLGLFAYTANGRSDYEASGDARRAYQRQLAFGRRIALALYEPALLSGHAGSRTLGFPGGVQSHDRPGRSAPDSIRDYRSVCDSGDARFHPGAEVGRGSIPSQVDAAALACGLDSRDTIRQRSPGDSGAYFHPYSSAAVAYSAVVHHAPVYMARAGVAEVGDLTVAGASHYVTSGGFIASNCGIDEATQIPEQHLRYLYSRLRKPETMDVPLRMRLTANPGGISHEYVKRRYILEGEQNGRRFIPSLLADNPSLDQEAYTAQLQELDPLTRQRLLNGDWDAVPEGGFFKREWFEIVPTRPRGVRWLRYWDRAATEPKPGTDPDYTAGCLIGLKAGVWYIADMKRFRLNSGGNEHRILETALSDGGGVEIAMEHEPGSAGKDVIHHYAKRVLSGFNFRGDRPTGSKVERAAPVASAAENRLVKLVEGPWIGDFMDEACAFPLGSHLDQVDAVSGGFGIINKRPRLAQSVNIRNL